MVWSRSNRAVRLGATVLAGAACWGVADAASAFRVRFGHWAATPQTAGVAIYGTRADMQLIANPMVETGDQALARVDSENSGGLIQAGAVKAPGVNFVCGQSIPASAYWESIPAVTFIPNCGYVGGSVININRRYAAIRNASAQIWDAWIDGVPRHSRVLNF